MRDLRTRADELLVALEERGRVVVAFERPTEARAISNRLNIGNSGPVRTILRTLDDGRTVLLAFTKTTEQEWLKEQLQRWSA